MSVMILIPGVGIREIVLVVKWNETFCSSQSYAVISTPCHEESSKLFAPSFSPLNLGMMKLAVQGLAA